MIRETIVPAIPDVRDDNVKDVLRAIKATLDVREGSIGDPLDQGVTLRDLTALNLAVAYTVPTAAWVNFKLFGLLGLTLTFMLVVGVWVSRHVKEAPDV